MDMEASCMGETPGRVAALAPGKATRRME